jgi:hypothetical protein
LHRRLNASRLQVTGAPRNRCLGTSYSHRAFETLWLFCALLPATARALCTSNMLYTMPLLWGSNASTIASWIE